MNYSLSKQQLELDESYSFSLRNYQGHKTSFVQGSAINGRNSIVRGTDTLRSNHSCSQSQMNEDFQKSYKLGQVEQILHAFDQQVNRIDTGDDEPKTNKAHTGEQSVKKAKKNKKQFQITEELVLNAPPA